MRRLSGNGGGSAPRARTVAFTVASKTGLLATVSGFGLLAPIAFVKTGGNANLAINAGTGGISATAAIAEGASQSLTGTATGADGCVIPFTAVLTGRYAITFAPLSATISTVTAAGTQVAAINGVPPGELPQITPNDGRFVIGGSEAAGWKLLRGLSDVSVGTVDLTIAAAGAQSGVVAVTVTLPAAADYVVSSDAEWDAVFANSAATLAGKTVEIVGSAFTQRTIAGKDFTAAGAPLTLRSRNAAAKLPSLLLSGVVRGLNAIGLNLQMTGWPARYAGCVQFGTGTYNVAFHDCTFRHGYGANQVDFDMTATYPEYERVNNVYTASTVSQTFALTWKDPASSGGWIEFFNRGSSAVYVVAGNSSVVATTGSTLVPAGGYARISSGVSPQTTTHVAVMAASGTSEFNARTEIGMAEYLAYAFSASGAAVMERIDIVGNTFRDLLNGVKGIGTPSFAVVMDNDLDRIYMDLISFAPKPGTGVAHVYRNLMTVPFASQGIAEGLTGDARDPHGDAFQGFGDGSATIRNVFSAGNITLRPPTRNLAGDVSQGMFWSDNDNVPSYDNVFSIADAWLGGNTNAINCGEAAFPAGNLMVYGVTAINTRDIAGGASAVRMNTDGNYNVYIASVVTQSILTDNKPYSQDRVVNVRTAANPAAVFPNIAAVPAARTREQVLAAITTAAEGAGLGAAACQSAVDWTTTDHAAVIQWQNIPSGVFWRPQTGADIGATYTLPKCKVLNRRAAQAVAVADGLEWQSYASDGVTVVQAWTSAPGTVVPDQYVSIRGAASASGATAVAFGYTVNGFAHSVSVKTKAAAPSQYLTLGSLSRFQDPAGAMPANVSKIEWRGQFYFPALPTASAKFFLLSSSSADLEYITSGGGRFRASVKDSAGVTNLSQVAFGPAAPFATATWYEVSYVVDYANNKVTLTINNVSYDLPFATTSTTGLAPSTRYLLALASGTLTPVPAGTRVANLAVYLNDVLYKQFSNVPPTANADAWKLGADFV